MAITQTTTSVLKFSASGDAITSTTFVRYFRWVGATLAGDSLNVQDTAGNEYMKSEANGANFLDICPIGRHMTGINVASMGSGALYAYIGAPYHGISYTRSD